MSRVDTFCDKYWKWILVVIILFGLYLRISSLAVDSLWLDESISALASQGVLENGYPSFVSGATYDRAYVFHYLMAGSLWLFGGDFGVRFVSVVFGLLTVLLGFYFGRRFSGSTFVGLTFAVLLAVSSLEVIYSKQARMYQMFQLMYFLSFFLFYYFVIEKKKLFGRDWVGYAVVVISTLVCVDTQLMGLILIPLFAIVYLINSPIKVGRLLWIGGLAVISFIYLFFRLTASFADIERISTYLLLYNSTLLTFVPFLLVTLIGLVYFFISDLKKALCLSLVTIVPLVGLSFITQFSTRYVYFALFTLLFFTAYILGKIKYRVPVVALLLIFYAGTMFTFAPIALPNLDNSSPVADYRGAYHWISNSNLTIPIIAGAAPPAGWYGNLDYWYRISYTGQKNETRWTDFNGVEAHTNAKIISSLPQNESFFFVDDVFTGQGVNESVRSHLQFCEVVYSSFRIDVKLCN